MVAIYSSSQGPSNIFTFHTIKKKTAKMQFAQQDHTKPALLSWEVFLLMMAKMLSDGALECEAETSPEGQLVGTSKWPPVAIHSCPEYYRNSLRLAQDWKAHSSSNSWFLLSSAPSFYQTLTAWKIKENSVLINFLSQLCLGLGEGLSFN